MKSELILEISAKYSLHFGRIKSFNDSEGVKKYKWKNMNHLELLVERLRLRQVLLFYFLRRI